MSRLRDSSGIGYEIVGLADSAKADLALELSDEQFAYDFLARLAQDPLNLPELRAFAADLSPDFSSFNTRDSDLLRFLAANLAARRLRVRGVKEERIVVDSNVPEEVETEAAPPEVPKPPEEEKTWIKFQVVYDDTGLPVSGVQLIVTYPDGTSKGHWTFEDGMVEITDIPRGEYAIKSMVYSDSFEVISPAQE